MSSLHDHLWAHAEPGHTTWHGEEVWHRPAGRAADQVRITAEFFPEPGSEQTGGGRHVTTPAILRVPVDLVVTEADTFLVRDRVWSVVTIGEVSGATRDLRVERLAPHQRAGTRARF